ncbi:MAG: TolC family protein [Deltaproteobacteria bacterium]|nr:TolC family protein [Deltaproteobacteria bacterium]
MNRSTPQHVPFLFSLSLLAFLVGSVDAAPAPTPKNEAASQPKPTAKPTASQPTLYNLPRLIKRAARLYPGLTAARAAVQEMRANVSRAKWGWIPQARIKGLVAPSPNITCYDATGAPSSERCITTTNPNASWFDIGGIFGRLQVDLVMPIYTFDKLGSARRAAEAGVKARQAQLRAAKAALAYNITRAYWGLKLARESLYVVRNGRKHLVKERARVEKQLDDEEGEVTVTDLLRLKTFTAVVDTRVLEGVKLERVTKTILATLIRLDSFKLEPSIIAPVSGKILPLSRYLALARQHRPEVRLLDAALGAQRAAQSLEKSRFYPDFLIVATARLAGAQGADDPKNAFYNDPFNVFTGGFGLALNWTLDPVQQYHKYQAAKAKSAYVAAKRDEALIGIEIDIKRAYEDLRNALARMGAARKGQKSARSWLTATVQSLSAGLGKPKDLTDVLPTYFELKLKYLQAIYDVNIGWAKLAHAIGLAKAERS